MSAIIPVVTKTEMPASFDWGGTPAESLRQPGHKANIPKIEMRQSRQTSPEGRCCAIDSRGWFVRHFIP
jgi:hypothetical protein